MTSAKISVGLEMKVTYICTATMLIEIGAVGGTAGLKILTDPALDPAGKRYPFKFGTSSRKTAGPALSAEQIGDVDVVLLSHDEHADNLDDAGRAFLPRARRIFTTPEGGRRLGRDLGSKVQGLASWQTAEVKAPEGWTLKIHAVPARHGQWPLAVRWFGREPSVGACTGFVLEWPGQEHGAVYISGDTVYFKGLGEIAERFSIGTAFLHLGSVKFSISGGLRYTCDGRDGVRIARALKPRVVVPLHFDGWTHFHEPLEASLKAFEAEGLAARVHLLGKGVAEVVGG